MNWNENVRFPKHCKPLPPGYRIVQLDSGHYLWCLDADGDGDHEVEGLICWDKWWVRRCAFAHALEQSTREAK